MTSSKTGRYLSVFDPKVVDLKTVVDSFARSGVKTVEQFEFLNTVVVSGDWKAARKTADETPGITSIEPEGSVHTQE
jgi:hypothetical protein